jgi:hypothetical protein
MLYDIASLKRPATDLLEIMLQNGQWPEEAKQKVLSDLAQYIAQKTGKPVVDNAKFADPVQKELAGIKSELQQRKEAEARAAQEAQQKKVNDAYNARITELCKEFKEDAGFYGSQVAARIAGNPGILQQIAKGNFAQVNKLFADVRNEDVARFKRWNDGLLKGKKDLAAQKPNQISGGQGQPNSAQQPTFKNEEERKAHALKIFRGEQ